MILQVMKANLTLIYRKYTTGDCFHFYHVEPYQKRSIAKVYVMVEYALF